MLYPVCCLIVVFSESFSSIMITLLGKRELVWPVAYVLHYENTTIQKF